MSKPLACALALSLFTLAPAIASAKGGGHMGGGMKHGESGSVRVQVSAKPSVTFKKMKVMHCAKYGRGDGQGGTTMVTVCN